MVCVTGEAKLLIIELGDARHKLDLVRAHSHSYVLNVILNKAEGVIFGIGNLSILRYI